MAGGERDVEHNLKCVVCGSKNVEVRKTYDTFCFESMMTHECRCVECNAEWFDDTISSDSQK